MQKEIGNNKIGIVGLWTGRNYGAVLTAWALYFFLEKKGYEPYLIDFQDGVNKESESGTFIRKECRVISSGTTIHMLEELNEIFDIFLVGSDQCWRGSSDGAFLGKYGGYKFFLNFTKCNKKRISYATSFGVAAFEGTDIENELCEKYLKRFDSISIREKRPAEYYSKKLGMDIAWTIDPVFLTEKDEFIRFAEKSDRYKNGEKRILGLFLDYNSSLERLYYDICSRFNLNGSIILGEDYSNVEGLPVGDAEESVSIYDYLRAIYCAEFVVTDSYHAMCFSIIFHKPFLVCLNEWRGKERFVSILDFLDLSDRGLCVSGNNHINIDCIETDFDWEEIDQRIDQKVKESVEWLKDALEKPIKGKTESNQDIGMLTAEVEDRFFQNLYRFKEYEERFNIAKSYLEYLEKRIVDLCHDYDILKGNIVNMRAVRLRDYVDSQLDKGDHIAIRGGGDHTCHLLDLMERVFEKKQVKIRYIINKTESSVRLPKGCSLITPDDFIMHVDEIDKVIVSSSKYGSEMKKELSMICPERMIIDPYVAFVEDELFPYQGWYDM